MKNQKIEQAIVAIMFVVAMFFAFIQGTSAQTDLEYERIFSQEVKVYDNDNECNGTLIMIGFENQLGGKEQAVMYAPDCFEGSFLTYVYTHNDYKRVKLMCELLELYNMGNTYDPGVINGIHRRYISKNDGIIIGMEMVSDQVIKMLFLNTETDEEFNIYLDIISEKPFN